MLLTWAVSTIWSAVDCRNQYGGTFAIEQEGKIDIGFY